MKKINFKIHLLLKSFVIIFYLNFLLLINIYYINIKNKNIKNKNIKNKNIKHIYNNNYKICICTIGKNENNYIREFIEYYKKFGVDKIFLYDNNDLKGETFDVIINDYINNNYVEIINYRGYKTPQKRMMNECYKHNYLKYDWFIFNDIDEYIYLKNYSSIKEYLNDYKFNNCTIIYLNWIYFTDNNNLYYQNKSLSKRFTEINFKVSFNLGKSILRSNKKKIRITNAHYITKKIKPCNGFGKIINKFRGYLEDHKYYYIKHYSSKSTEEFINKIIQGNVAYINNNKTKLKKIRNYFKINKITLEKINIFEEKTGINLNMYRNKIK